MHIAQVVARFVSDSRVSCQLLSLLWYYPIANSAYLPKNLYCSYAKKRNTHWPLALTSQAVWGRHIRAITGSKLRISSIRSRILCLCIYCIGFIIGDRLLQVWAGRPHRRTEAEVGRRHQGLWRNSRQRLVHRVSLLYAAHVQLHQHGNYAKIIIYLRADFQKKWWRKKPIDSANDARWFFVVRQIFNPISSFICKCLA